MTFNDIFNAVTTGFANFRFTDALDILIITVMFFWLIRFAKKSRAYQLLRGVAIAFLVLVISQLFGLNALTWLLDNLLLSGIVFIAIIFQPELRRAFEHLGRGRKMFDRTGDNRAVRDAIEKAALSMSKSHIGALIIFQNKTALGDSVERGTTLDAIISDELIENIFYPKAPLHDGAVIINEMKIAAAGCVLPLNAELDLPRELGTRHRAALTISTLSDCVSLVVSEETGAISYAQDGVLRRNLSVHDLRELLKGLFPDTTVLPGENKLFSKIFKKEKN